MTWLTQYTGTLLRTLNYKADKREALLGQSWVIRAGNVEPRLLPETPVVLQNAADKPFI